MSKYQTIVLEYEDEIPVNNFGQINGADVVTIAMKNSIEGSEIAEGRLILIENILEDEDSWDVIDKYLLIKGVMSLTTKEVLEKL